MSGEGINSSVSCRLAREAEEALAAKEMELKHWGPQREQHAKALAPLQSDHVAVRKCAPSHTHT